MEPKRDLSRNKGQYLCEQLYICWGNDAVVGELHVKTNVQLALKQGKIKTMSEGNLQDLIETARFQDARTIYSLDSMSV
jgi:hypothetical protein